ncbi:MAG TPA: hypothetical protein PK213_13720 [Deltaproteobacteria bacterium]|jgi:hypothetical protein|nr:hypothetical protein [Deltaproteobacteria bacterium]
MKWLAGRSGLSGLTWLTCSGITKEHLNIEKGSAGMPKEQDGRAAIRERRVAASFISKLSSLTGIRLSFFLTPVTEHEDISAPISAREKEEGHDDLYRP